MSQTGKTYLSKGVKKARILQNSVYLYLPLSSRTFASQILKWKKNMPINIDKLLISEW